MKKILYTLFVAACILLNIAYADGQCPPGSHESRHTCIPNGAK